MSIFKKRKKTFKQLKKELHWAERDLRRDKAKVSDKTKKRVMEKDIKFLKSERRKLKYRKIIGIGGKVKRTGIKTGRALTSKRARRIYKETGRTGVSLAKKLFKEYKKATRTKRRRKTKRRRRMPKRKRKRKK